ncbi:MAG: YcaQ family DNA glycosylase [Acidimicrobiales bacterium]|nr:YcaQ family DNA glycosylase [Acidimicrobiales bacterium]
MVESSLLPIRSLRADQARKLALRAQGFSGTKPSAGVDARHGRKVFKQLGVIQIDSVNVLCRSQELPLFARLGSHRRDLIHNLTEAQDIFEYWGHEASHLPVGMHPLLRWRMAEAIEGKGIWGDVAAVARQDPALIANVLAQIVEHGPLSVSEIEGGGERGEHMWAWSPGKRALEYLFWSGRITARRGPNFERRYDLAERMLPTKVLDEKTPNPLEAKKDLLEIAARAHGVGTAKDLADYYRLNVVESRTLLGELVNEGRLARCEVEGWTNPPIWTREQSWPKSTPGGLCCHRSILLSGNATVRSGSLDFVTALRSMCPRPSGSTATTCWRFCSMANWWHGWT